MSVSPAFAVTPSAAASAYSRVDSGAHDPGDFGTTLQRAMEGAIDTVRGADVKAVEALSGGGNLTEVVTAIAHAELTLQTATAVRDRVVQAYQDIMKMPI